VSEQPLTADTPEARLRRAMAEHPNATYVRVEVIDLRATLDAARAGVPGDPACNDPTCSYRAEISMGYWVRADAGDEGLRAALHDGIEYRLTTISDPFALRESIHGFIDAALAASPAPAGLDVERLAQAIQDVDFAADLPASGHREPGTAARRKAARYAAKYAASPDSERPAAGPRAFGQQVISNAEGERIARRAVVKDE